MKHLFIACMLCFLIGLNAISTLEETVQVSKDVNTLSDHKFLKKYHYSKVLEAQRIKLWTAIRKAIAQGAIDKANHLQAQMDAITDQMIK